MINITVQVDEREAELRAFEDAIVGRMMRRLSSLIGEPWREDSARVWDQIILETRREATSYGVDPESGRQHVETIAKAVQPSGFHGTLIRGRFGL